MPKVVQVYSNIIRIILNSPHLPPQAQAPLRIRMNTIQHQSNQKLIHLGELDLHLYAFTKSDSIARNAFFWSVAESNINIVFLIFYFQLPQSASRTFKNRQSVFVFVSIGPIVWFGLPVLRLVIHQEILHCDRDTRSISAEKSHRVSQG